MPDTYRKRLRQFVAAALIAAPMFAHGWASPPPPPPPPPPPAGGGNVENQQTIGGSTQGEFETPSGGATQGGETGGNTNGNGTGGTTPAPSMPATFRAGPATARGGNERSGGRATPGKSKGMMSMWDEKVGIPWKAVLLPSIRRDDYNATAGTVADGIRLPQANGGWAREDRPSLVVLFDSANADHKRLLATLESDMRLKTAANFFNCFKLDAAGTKVGDAQLYVFGRDGSELARIAGQRKFNGAYDTLEIAYRKEMKVDLAAKAPHMDAYLKTKAYIEYRTKQIEGGIVCPDCGHEREDIVEELGTLKVRGNTCDTSIAMLRQPATK